MGTGCRSRGRTPARCFARVRRLLPFRREIHRCRESIAINPPDAQFPGLGMRVPVWFPHIHDHAQCGRRRPRRGLSHSPPSFPRGIKAAAGTHDDRETDRPVHVIDNGGCSDEGEQCQKFQGAVMEGLAWRRDGRLARRLLAHVPIFSARFAVYQQSERRIYCRNQLARTPNENEKKTDSVDFGAFEECSWAVR
jgi:hypothetical protein